jgi:DNA-binding FadR family transcriptional regulator
MNDNPTLASLFPLPRTRLHEEIVERLVGKIIVREIKPGEKLPTERILAETLRVNRSTIREALNKLESMELIEIRHGDGVYVKDYLDSGSLEVARHLLFKDGFPDLAVMRNLADLRRILVPEMARLAAANRSADDLNDLERVVFHRPEMPPAERDWRVHNIIARAGGNILFLILLNLFTSLLRRYAHLYFDREENAARSAAFHREIFKAIKNRAPEKARKLALEIYEYSERAMTDMIGQTGYPEAFLAAPANPSVANQSPGSTARQRAGKRRKRP